MYLQCDLDLERRVAYVACTRAKNKLYLTCASRRMLYGYKVSNQPSQFLEEFVGGAKKKIKKETEVIDTKPKVEMKNDTAYSVGDKVKHKMYGEGIVVSLNGVIGTICFTSQGVIKSFDMTHPAITKLD